MSHFAIADAFSWLPAYAGFAVPAAFRALALATAPIFVAALWQGAAVAAGLALCLCLAPRLSAAHRFVVWAAGFAVLAGLEFLPVFAHSTSGAGTGAGGALAGLSTQPWLELSAGWSLGIAALWIALAALRAGDLLLHSIRLRRLWKSAVPVEDYSGTAVTTLQGRGRVQVCIASELDRPSVIGFFAPRILIPDWLYARLTPSELRQVVLHEAEHLRRHDDWTNLFQKLCLVLFPLNPALAWIERRLCREREMACDEGVVRITGAPRSYAACLAGLAERRLQRRAGALGALSLGAFERRPELAHRVHSILLRKNVLNPIGAGALLGLVGCGLVFGSLELARCPQMVAFVPAHSLASAAVAQTAQADGTQVVPAAYLLGREPAFTAAASGFRAVNAVAILPANASRTAVLHAARRTAASQQAPWMVKTKASRLAPAEPGQHLLRAEIRGRATNPAEAAQPQGWVVFTAWQVQTSTQSAGITADYETDANGAARQTANENENAAASATSSQPSAPASQITVTRLILRIYPARPAASSAAGSTHAQQAPISRPDSSSNSDTKPVLSRPTALPFDSGWLVIQL